MIVLGYDAVDVAAVFYGTYSCPDRLGHTMCRGQGVRLEVRCLQRKGDVYRLRTGVFCSG